MRNKIWIIVSSALLSACAVGPDFKAPEPALPQQWRDSAVTSDAIEQQWWKQFHDATLDDLVERALANNADVQLAPLRAGGRRPLRLPGKVWPVRLPCTARADPAQTASPGAA